MLEDVRSLENDNIRIIQLVRLQSITNQSQRDILRACLGAGLYVPSYAWTLLPNDWAPAEPLTIEYYFREMINHYTWFCDLRDGELSVDELLGGVQWNWKIEGIINQLIPTNGNYGYCLGEPVSLGEDIPHETIGRVMTILQWGIFNPYGPTHYECKIIESASQGVWLLCIQMVNPFECELTGYGVFPGFVAEEEGFRSIRRAVTELFRLNGVGSHSLFEAFPSYVFAGPDIVPGEGAVGELFHSACLHICSTGLESICNILEKHPQDPWACATNERRQSFKETKTNTVEAESFGFTETLWERWWNIVSDEGHVRAYMAQLAAAWNGAIRSARGEFLENDQ